MGAITDHMAARGQIAIAHRAISTLMKSVTGVRRMYVGRPSSLVCTAATNAVLLAALCPPLM